MKQPLPDLAASEQLGRLLAEHLPPGPVMLYLHGDLGVGKTTIARALLRALGVKGAVRSPTYTLIERYDTQAGEIAHLDLYRIADPQELEYLALDELVTRARLWLVEWPQRGQGLLPGADLHLHLDYEVDATRAMRLMTLRAATQAGQAWADALAVAWAELS